MSRPLARALLAAEAGLDDDLELRADVLTELARCAVDDAPDTADDALDGGRAGVAGGGMRTRVSRR